LLRPYTLSEIHRAITASGYFKPADFLIEGKDLDGGTDLRIQYRYDPSHFLAVMVPLKKDQELYGNLNTLAYWVRGRVSPGELNAEEPVTFNGLEGLKRGISDWLIRVRSEIQSGPFMRQVVEQEQQLADLLRRVEQMPDDYFSNAEAGDLRGRLDKLEFRLSENLTENTQDQEELSAKLKDLALDIQMLKDGLGHLKKTNWAKALTIRAFEWIKDPINRRLIGSGAEIAKELLLGAGKHSTSAAN